jgi:hypothetical protein
MQQMQMGRENLSPALAVGQTTYIRVAGGMIMNNNSSWGE